MARRREETLTRKDGKSGIRRYAIDTLGLKSSSYPINFLYALIVVWLMSAVAVILMRIFDQITITPLGIVIHVVSTLALTLIVLFSANCFASGGCSKSALVIVLTGVALLTLATLRVS
tara:strand:- start:2635 stop:2988 length:354 start_codon:yes stop_codon:yes gene_type:complete